MSGLTSILVSCGNTPVVRWPEPEHDVGLWNNNVIIQVITTEYLFIRIPGTTLAVANACDRYSVHYFELNRIPMWMYTTVKAWGCLCTDFQ